MPRIDPFLLLKCLSVLLSPEGGINSREEVPRLVNLMTKFSKKLVSKCVYLLILKSTDVTLVDMFMTSGGWLLIHTWLQEAMTNSNWNLVQEVLELLLITPVDSTRLRLNNIPKLVKTLSKREDLGDVKEMATTLVNNWLAIVKNSTPVIQEEKTSVKSPEVSDQAIEDVKEEEKIEESPMEPQDENPVVTNEIETIELPEPPVVEEEPVKMEVEDENTISTSMFYKITVRDGKQVLTKLTNSEEVDDKPLVEDSETSEPTNEKKKNSLKVDDNKVDTKKDTKSKSSSNDAKSSSSGSNKKSSSSSRSSSSSKDKDKKHSSRHSSKSSSSSRDKDRSKKDREKENDRDKHRSNGSSKHSSSSSAKSSSSTSSSKSKDRKDSRESKEKQAEKDKDTLEKLKPVTLDKIGRIPKKPSFDEKEKEVKKKPSISIEPKRKGEDRPKTVKIFNSKMRSTGLEEEVKPPPPRSAVKKPPPVIPATLPTKRPSPQRDNIPAPPEKKMKLEMPERIGAIKLIPPKPKPAFLQESDIFMDALTAASSKKEPKRKKRRLSQSKEPEETNTPQIQQAPSTPPIGIKNYSPANFYQETLDDTNENEVTEKNKSEDLIEKNTDIQNPTESTNEEKDDKKEVSDGISEVSEPSTRTNSDGLKGALVYFKKKGPKRSIRWKDDKVLVDIRYFELDETERVNVSRPNFTELAKLDMTHEREALLGRKLNNEDLMEPTTAWRVPYLVDQPELPVQPGSKSLEKDIQYARSKNTLQALYFNKHSIPDSPGEPIPEIHPMVDPVSIPLEDAESQICDLRNTPWPEPKGMAPVEQAPVNIPPMFQSIPGPFPNFPQMGPQGFPGLQGPRFGPPNMMPNGPHTMMPNNMNIIGNPNMNIGPPMDIMNQGPMNQTPMNQIPMNQGPMNPNVFGPNGPNMDGFNPMMNENQNFPMPFNQPNMFGPPNNNFNNMERGGVHRGRGSFRRGHNNWNRNIPRGGNSWRGGNSDHRGGRICKNVKNHGYCRKIDSCPFIHPN